MQNTIAYPLNTFGNAEKRTEIAKYSTDTLCAHAVVGKFTNSSCYGTNGKANSTVAPAHPTSTAAPFTGVAAQGYGGGMSGWEGILVLGSVFVLGIWLV